MFLYGKSVAQTRNKPDRCIGYPTNKELDEIDWLSAAANYVTLRVGAESYLLREGIGHISERLDPNNRRKVFAL
jgi:hypothetical protein